MLLIIARGANDYTRLRKSKAVFRDQANFRRLLQVLLSIQDIQKRRSFQSFSFLENDTIKIFSRILNGLYIWHRKHALDLIQIFTCTIFVYNNVFIIFKNSCIYSFSSFLWTQSERAFRFGKYLEPLLVMTIINAIFSVRFWTSSQQHWFFSGKIIKYRLSLFITFLVTFVSFNYSNNIWSISHSALLKYKYLFHYFFLLYK